MNWYTPLHPQLPLSDRVIRIGYVKATGNDDTYMCGVYYDQADQIYIVEHKQTFDGKELPFCITIVAAFINQYAGSITDYINSLVGIVEDTAKSNLRFDEIDS